MEMEGREKREIFIFIELRLSVAINFTEQKLPRYEEFFLQI
jgi:hypothetical protein